MKSKIAFVVPLALLAGFFVFGDVANFFSKRKAAKFPQKTSDTASKSSSGSSSSTQDRSDGNFVFLKTSDGGVVIPANTVKKAFIKESSIAWCCDERGEYFSVQTFSSPENIEVALKKVFGSFAIVESWDLSKVNAGSVGAEEEKKESAKEEEKSGDPKSSKAKESENEEG